jgi:collagen type I/II/III/V/XI/XXIV/XXVII alpha
MGAVISFFRPAATSQGGWSQQELAEFYRVEAALIRAGLQIGSEQGLSDEAEPWFVFCRPDGDAIMHFARIDGSYVIASEVLDSPMRGSDFRALINQVAQRPAGRSRRGCGSEPVTPRRVRG